MKPPEQVAREIAEDHRSDFLHLGNMVADRKLQARIAAALTAARREAIEECAKVAEDEGRTNVENPAIDMLEHARRQGIRWCGEWAANRIRALAKTGGGA
jgi:predicted DNA-binding transcriptional regulator YafY